MTDEPRRVCYATPLGGCAGGLSREHYVSASILRRLNVDRGLAVRDTRFGTTPKLLQPEALGARILCERHNSALSILDQEALRFFDAIDDGYRLSTVRGKKPDVFIDGPLLERWALKVLVGLIASGGAGGDRQVSVEWLKVLFGVDAPGVGCGIFWVPEPRALRPPSEGRGVSLATMVHPEHGVQGIHLDVNSVNLFYFAKPVRTDERAQIHPVRFKMRHEVTTGRFELRLTWPVPPEIRPTAVVTFSNTPIAGLAKAS